MRRACRPRRRAGDATEDSDIALRVTVTVKGDGIKMDFAGASAPVAGNVNCPRSVTLSACLFRATASRSGRRLSRETEVTLKSLDTAAQRVDLDFEGPSLLQLAPGARRTQRPVNDGIERYKPLGAVDPRHHPRWDLGSSGTRSATWNEPPRSRSVASCRVTQPSSGRCVPS